MNNLEASMFASRFWHEAGLLEPYPRSLEEVATRLSNTVLVIRFKSLQLSDVEAYLSASKIPCLFPPHDRALRGFLFAFAGFAFIFLDELDAENEKRFSFAHELSHFLLEHYWPRQEAVRKYGSGIVDVLNGVRIPSIEERLDSILAGISIQGCTHLSERNVSGNICRNDVLEAEDRADRLALELLAPFDIVTKQVTVMGCNWSEETASEVVSSLLFNYFGLPASTADTYGSFIVQQKRGVQTFREWLR